MEGTDIRIVKSGGQVFTPSHLVSGILDCCSYVPGNIICKHIIDNSCGDGAFMCEIVSRYCKEYVDVNHNATGLRDDLQTYIHGIEIDRVAYEKCLHNVENIARQYGIRDVKWDIANENALSETRHSGKMDFVVGNPPYVRVHNLDKSYNDVKMFRFTQGGMTDLYLAFFELGFNMLNATGRLCYITPSSWLSSLAASVLRNYILRKRTLVEMIDLGHYQAFEGVTTYTVISLFDKQNKSDVINYYVYSPETHSKAYVDTFSYNEMYIGGRFYLAPRSSLKLMRKIMNPNLQRYVSVKNGFATLADKVFITGVTFSEMTIPVLKASTGKWYKGFFPYGKNGKPLHKDYIFSNPEIATYLERNKNVLLKNKTEKQCPDWYLYGRTQALKDVFADKYAINTIIKDIKSIKLTHVPEGSGLYSGLYILTYVSQRLLEKLIKCDDFINYLRILKNYKSGGYYTFNSRDLERYLNYKISQNEDKNSFTAINKHELLECSI